nr:ribonuclease H-like domain-containing protein [Tanacetum cinerariifolium]
MFEIYCNEITIRELRKKLETVQKEKDGIQLTVKKLENASKSLNKLIYSQIIDNCKKGLGYNAVPPPYIVETLNAKTSEEDLKVVKKDNGALIIEDLKSNNEDKSVPQPKIEKKTVKPSVANVEFGNMSYLTDYEKIDRGYVAFGGNPKEGNHWQRVPRKTNMYSIDLKNIIPKRCLTCLFAKVTSDESRLWHKRLGRLNFKTMNKLVKGNLVRGTQSNGNAGTKDDNNAGQARKEKEPGKDYILLPLWTVDPPFPQEPKSSQDAGFKPFNDVGKKFNEVSRQKNKCKDQEEKDSVKSTNKVNAVSSTVSASSNEVNAVGRKSSIELSNDPREY